MGLCAEFPSLSFLAASHAEALAGIRALVRDVLEDMGTSGEQTPAPFADRKYSGRFVVPRGVRSHAQKRRTPSASLLLARAASGE